MAQVLRRGNKHIESQIYEHTCSKCDSLIKYNMAEDSKVDQRSGSYVVCPVCGFTVTANDVRRGGTRPMDAVLGVPSRGSDA